MEVLIIVICIAVIFYSFKFQNQVLSSAGFNKDFTKSQNRIVNETIDSLIETEKTKYGTIQDRYNGYRIQLGRWMSKTIKNTEIYHNELSSDAEQEVRDYLNWYYNAFQKVEGSKDDKISLSKQEELAVDSFNETCETITRGRYGFYDNDKLYRKEYRKGNERK